MIERRATPRSADDDEKTLARMQDPRQSTTHSFGDFAHDFRNGLAGVRSAVQIVRDALGSCPERDILGAALARLDRIDRQLRELMIDETESANRSGVRRIVLPPRDAE